MLMTPFIIIYALGLYIFGKNVSQWRAGRSLLSSIPLKDILIIISIVILIASINIWNSNYFQRNIFPLKYWTNEVARLEQGIQSSEYFYNEFKKDSVDLFYERRESQKERLEFYSRLKQLGYSETEIIKIMDDYDKVQEKVDEGMEFFRNSVYNSIKKSKEDLEKAKKELDKYSYKK